MNQKPFERNEKVRSIHPEPTTAADGSQYYVIGRSRIKVTEHFAAQGKTIDSLMEDLIRRAANE